MKMKKRTFYLALTFLLMIILLPFQVFANDHYMSSQSIYVVLDENGTATITDRRSVHLTEGTENYIVIGNLGDSEITDFVVTENGQTYEFESTWDIDRSRQEKAFKNGMIETSSGYELAWGIGDYGSHEYVLTYTVTNFIKQLEDDDQILFWRFVNDETNIPPQKVTVTIDAPFELNPDNAAVWSFGYDGRIEIMNGQVEAVSHGPLDSSDYLTILTRFPEGSFQTTSQLNQTFEEVQDQAFKGSDYGIGKESSNFFDGFWERILPYFVFIILGFNFLIVFFIGFLVRPKKFKRQYEEEYYRDLPYEGPVSDIYHLLMQMGAVNFEKIMTGYLLKWINEGRITTREVERGRIFKKMRTVLNISNGPSIVDKYESKLFDMVKEASGDDRVLEENEFSKWASKHYSQIESWKKGIKKDSKLKMQELGFLKAVNKKILIFDRTVFELTPEGEKLEKNIYQFINYLHDFSLLNERRSVNVQLWDELMIWAGYFGITEEVMKEFKELYPEYETESVYRGSAIYHTRSFSKTVARSATRSSGGGGSSSSGGGGGSFGGGSGGGTR